MDLFMVGLLVHSVIITGCMQICGLMDGVLTDSTYLEVLRLPSSENLRELMT